MPRVLIWSDNIDMTEISAGRLKSPENLYENVTNSVGRLLPANKGTVQNLETKVEGLEEYKTETSGVINNLVSKINSLTPVSKPTLAAC